MNKPAPARRVLIVEDEALVSWVLEDILIELGYEVVGPAARIDQALAIIEAETFDLVLLDVNLNGQKSYPIADALLARNVPFIFSTAYNSNGIPSFYQTHPFMQKPYSKATLDAMLQRVLPA